MNKNTLIAVSITTLLSAQPALSFFGNLSDVTSLIGQSNPDVSKLFNFDSVKEKEERDAKEKAEFDNYTLPDSVNFDDEEQNQADIAGFTNGKVTDFTGKSGKVGFELYGYKDRAEYEEDMLTGKHAMLKDSGVTAEGLEFIKKTVDANIDGDWRETAMDVKDKALVEMTEEGNWADGISGLSGFIGSADGLFSGKNMNMMDKTFESINSENIAKGFMLNIQNDKEMRGKYQQALKDAKANGQEVPEWMTEDALDNGEMARRMGNMGADGLRNSADGILKDGVVSRDKAQKKAFEKLNSFDQNKDKHVKIGSDLFDSMFDNDKTLGEIITGEVLIDDK